ncbi:DUF805 domain-containing protein [Aerococcaceae bacterium NML191292]|nr:DUF805 domain-containing protein [Aerococcaceae bacterium NML191292]MCW6682442.1 DUF805 domain-containing protein [Aerococcaceae bacterium NML160702]
MSNQRNRRVSFAQATKEYFTGVFDFKGFATREGYWKAFLGEIILRMAMSFLAVMMPFELWAVILLPVSIATFVCSISMEVRRMRDICMSTRGIWTYFGIASITVLLLMQTHETRIERVFRILGLLIALLPTNGLLKYKDTAFGKWFVDPSLENIVDTHNIQS